MKSTSADQSIRVLGINSGYHESAACLIQDGRIVAAVEEERFTRVRHAKHADLKNPHWLPEHSIRFCLAEAGIEPDALVHVAYSLSPELRLAGNICLDAETVPGGAGTKEGEEHFYRLLQQIPKRLSLLLGCDIRDRFLWIEHHLCHAASTFFVSPFEDAAVLSIDGIGETTSTWLGSGHGCQLQKLREIKYPNSLGFLWTKLSRFLGFGNYGQWKVMALASYGDSSRYYEDFRSFVTYDNSGDFRINGDILQFRAESCASLEQLFGKGRGEGDLIVDRHCDIAAALQRITNEVLVSIARWLDQKAGSKNLCMAGGVGLNCVTNHAILEESGFENLFVQPAANDAGTALGACYYVWNQMLRLERKQVLTHAYWGPTYPRDAECLVSQVNAEAVRKASNLAREIAQLIAQGKTVALFQGRMEFGPRALGNRSILADPRRSDMVQLLNEKVKHREWFRPFAASVLAESARDWFEIKRETAADQFMLLTYPIRPEKLGLIPAVTHVDGTTRIQTVNPEVNTLFYRLIQEFDRITGVPLVLNTSLNDREPIICTPTDALRMCLERGIEYLSLEDYMIDVAKCDESVTSLLGVTSLFGKELGDSQNVSPSTDLPVHEEVSTVFMSR